EAIFGGRPGRGLGPQIAQIAAALTSSGRFPDVQRDPVDLAADQARWQPLKKAVHRRLVADLDKSALFEELRHSGGDESGPRDRVRLVISELLDELAPELLDPVSRSRLIEDILAEKIGLGPFEPLLADASVTEIMANGPNTIFVERRGRIEKTDLRFTDDAQMLGVIERISLPVTLLSLFVAADGMLWTEEVTLRREQAGEMAALQVGQGAPLLAQAATLVQGPRNANRSGILLRAFAALFH
ncbi:MAG TPA: hypothetical protein PLK97_09310, partial [Pseudomonadales bacterium]|nr:hypothetical protein [Pseudomonadales bacterium]